MLRPTLAALTLAAITACATVPDPCTPEWVEYKTEKVLTSFARSNYGEVHRLKNFADTLENGKMGPLTALKIPGMIDDFKKLAVSFEKKALPELNAAVELCGDPQTLIPAFTGFLRKEGVGEEVLEWVEVLGTFVQSSST
jgi:hypothetical protein